MGSNNSVMEPGKVDKDKNKDYIMFLRREQYNRVQQLQSVQNNDKRPTYLTYKQQTQHNSTNQQAVIDSGCCMRQKEAQNWIIYLQGQCNELEQDYEWAQQILKIMQKHPDSSIFQPATQRNAQNDLIWTLRTLQYIDMQSNFDRNQKELNMQSQKSNKQIINSESQLLDKFEECDINIRQSNQNNSSRRKSQKNRSQLEDDGTEIQFALKQTELFIEDLQKGLGKQQNYSAIQDSKPSYQQIEFQNISGTKERKNPSSSIKDIGKKDKKNKKSSKDKSLKRSEQRDKNINNNFRSNNSVSTRDNSHSQRYYQNNTVITKFQPADVQEKQRMIKMMGFFKQTTQYIEKQFKRKKSVFYLMFDSFRKCFLKYYQQLFIEIIMDKENKKQEEKIKINKYQQQQQQGRQQREMSNGSRYLKKTILEESQIKIEKNKNKIHNNNFSRKQSLMSERFSEVLSKNSIFIDPLPNNKFQTQADYVQVQEDQEWGNSQRAQQRQSNSQYQNNNNDSGESFAQLDFKDYFELAVGEIQSFIDIVIDIIFEYYNLNGLQENYKYGKLLTHENIHNFVISFLFDEQVSSLLLQYCQKINFEDEHRYNKQLEKFDKITAQELGIRGDLLNISTIYNKSKLQGHGNFLRHQNYVYTDAIELFKKIEGINSPIHKLKVLIQVAEHIQKEIQYFQQNLSNIQNEQQKYKQISMAADDMQNAFVYIIGKSQIQNMLSQFYLIQRFINDNQTQGETGFLFTVAYGSVQFLLSFDLDSLKKQFMQNQEDFNEQLEESQEI